MKLSLIATAFAAILSTGYAENLCNSNSHLDDVPAAASPVTEAAPAQQGGCMEAGALIIDENTGKRTLGAKDDAIMGAAIEGEANGKRALGTKKDYSGQSCSLCCDDDYHC
jgi:hypothetical protein